MGLYRKLSLLLPLIAISALHPAMAISIMEPYPNAIEDAEMLSIHVKASYSNGEEFDGSMYGADEPAEWVSVRVYVSLDPQVDVIVFRVHFNGELVRDDATRILVWEKELHCDDYSDGIIIIQGFVQGIYNPEPGSHEIYEYSCLVVLDFEPIPLDPLIVNLIIVSSCICSIGLIVGVYKWRKRIIVVDD